MGEENFGRPTRPQRPFNQRSKIATGEESAQEPETPGLRQKPHRPRPRTKKQRLITKGGHACGFSTLRLLFRCTVTVISDICFKKVTADLQNRDEDAHVTKSADARKLAFLEQSRIYVDRTEQRL